MENVNRHDHRRDGRAVILNLVEPRLHHIAAIIIIVRVRGGMGSALQKLEAGNTFQQAVRSDGQPQHCQQNRQNCPDSDHVVQSVAAPVVSASVLYDAVAVAGEKSALLLQSGFEKVAGGFAEMLGVAAEAFGFDGLVILVELFG